MKKLLLVASVLAIGVVVLVAANPFYQDDPEFTYDDVALRIAVEGTWSVTVHSSPPRDLTLTITEAKGKAATRQSSRSFVRSANACSHRTFVRSAEACGDDSEMAVDVRIAGAAATTEGRFIVLGLELRDASFLELDLGDLNLLNARISPIGQASDATFDVPRKSGEVRVVDSSTPATMKRISAN